MAVGRMLPDFVWMGLAGRLIWTSGKPVCRFLSECDLEYRIERYQWLHIAWRARLPWTMAIHPFSILNST